MRSLDNSNYLAFKGGTCLVKVYFGYYRFSEDIDLTWFGSRIHRRDFRNQVLKPLMDSLTLEWDKQENLKTGIAGSHSGGVISYFLLSPPTGSINVKLKITVAFDEKLRFKAKLLKLNHVPIDDTIKRDMVATFGDIATGYFDTTDVWCYTLQEIACEKVRALLTRQIQPARSRDLVDLYKLAFGKGLKKAAPPAIVRSKLASALKIKAYKKEYTRTTQNLQKHIEQLVAESASDPVFMEKPNFDELNQFAQELKEYLGKEIIPKT